MTTKAIKKTTKKEAKSLELAVLDTKGKEVQKFELDKTVFDGKVSVALIHQAVVAYLANQRKGLACTKTRGEVRGGGAKPWRQKGTGRARVGSNRSPLWEGGGVTFGPKPRSYRKDLSKRMKILALKSALNAKFRDDQILIINELGVASPKTKEFSKIIDNLKLSNQKIRFVVLSLENNLKLATRNIKKILIAKASNVTTTEIIDCKKLILTKNALEEIQERVKKCL